MKTLTHLTGLGLVMLLAQAQSQAAVTSARVDRNAPDSLTLNWQANNPVDIFVGDRPGFTVKGAQLLSRGDRSGHYTVATADSKRRYFLLVDQQDHQQREVAEREVPLAQGSNFRDVGGYATTNGKHVRWGQLYRSGGQPLLTPADVEQVKGLGVTLLVDLRSSEERVIAPSVIGGIPYTAVGYSMGDLMRSTGSGGNEITNGADVYRNFPQLLAPQLRILFSQLLAKPEPIAYNCSAGQDRTGFVTAVILTALGVPYDTVVEDYHLSTALRRPENELPVLDPVAYANNPVAQYFVKAQQSSAWKTPQPLKDAEGRPFLRGAFEEINAKWGSMDAYLDKELGVGPQQLAALRKQYVR